MLYPEPPHSLQHPRIRDAFAFVGPGVIVASVTIGSGELVWASRSGALFGYSLLWCFLYAGAFKAILVYTAARHITLTGEHPITTWTKLPGPPLWFPLLIAVPAILVMPIAFSAIPEILGGFVHRLLGRPLEGADIGIYGYREFWLNVWSTFILTLCLRLAIGSKYQTLEKVSLAILAVLMVCVTTSVIVFAPDLFAVVCGSLVPCVPEYPEWLLTVPEYVEEFQGRSPWLEVSLYLMAVGGGAYDYIGSVGMIREKRWGIAGRGVASYEELQAAVESNSVTAQATLQRARQWVRAPFFDTSLSFLFVILVTLLFGILGALVLHGEHRVPVNDELLNEQEAFLMVLHPELRWVYRVGVFLAFLGTLYGAFEIYRQTFAESAIAILPNFATPKRIAMLKRGVVAYCFLGGELMMWLPQEVAGDVLSRMTFGTILTGATACGLWCFAMLWADRVRLPPALQMSWVLRLLTIVAGVSMTSLGFQTIIAYFQ